MTLSRLIFGYGKNAARTSAIREQSIDVLDQKASFVIRSRFRIINLCNQVVVGVPGPELVRIQSFLLFVENSLVLVS